MRELRHDFRAVYGVRYEDVDTDEAVDLVRTLRPGTLYSAATSVEGAWSQEEYLMADMIDALNLIACVEGGAVDEFKPMDRPRDVARAREKVKRARKAAKTLRETKWKDV